MNIFIGWVVIIIMLLGGYSYYLIRRSPKGYRLQVKLTILFILLVLIPTIPLTLVVSGLLSQGLETFLLPGVEESLARSLQVIKLQIEERGLCFLRNHPVWSNIDVKELNKFEILYAARFRFFKNTSQKVDEILTEPTKCPQFTPDTLALILSGELKSMMKRFEADTICEIYYPYPDSIISVVGFDISPQIMLAREEITESLKMYQSLSLFKQSVIEGRIIWGIATLFIILLALIAIYAARILSRGISEPIQQLASGMKSVAAGDLSVRVDVKAKDEIKILIDSFNKMADDLNISQQKLVQAERLAAWRDVARRISHEIKNSLTPIQLSLYRIKSKYFTEAQQTDDESLSAIEDEIESLRRMSEEFSQFARMPQIKREENDLNQLIQSLIPLIEGGTKPIKIELMLDSNLPRILIDRDQLKRALSNLLKNSVEASSIGGKIWVKTLALDHPTHKVKIEIEDQGQGMSEDILKKIFEPYFTTKKRGMGLGLSIVKRIIEDHEGEIFIESQERRGTKVTILI